MKYINKGEEPEEFTEWKKTQMSVGVNCDYKSLQNPEKRLLHSALLREQGYICCYCCRGIEQDSSHIEHLNPQSETIPDLSVDYLNMLASCGRYPNWPPHCGNKKGKTSISVSPLMPNCEEFFRYSGDGQILKIEDSAMQSKAQQTIDTLDLNHYDLKQMRFEALSILDGITEDEAQQLAEYYRQPDEQGKYQSFCTAILYFLRQDFGV